MKWATINKFFGYEPNLENLTTSQVILVLKEYDNGICECTSMGINSINGDFEGLNGCYDTILHKEQLTPIGMEDGEGFSGFVFDNGDWIRCGAKCHSEVIHYLNKINYKCNDNLIHLSSSFFGVFHECVVVHFLNEEMKIAMDIIEEYLSDEQLEEYKEEVNRYESFKI